MTFWKKNSGAVETEDRAGVTTTVDAEADQKALVNVLRDVERHAAGLMRANQQLADRGLHDAKFTAISGGQEYLTSWRGWLASNLEINL